MTGTGNLLHLVAAAWIIIGGVAGVSAQSLEGRYRGPTGEVVIKKQSGGSYTLQVEATNRRGACGAFSGRGTMRGQQIVATEGQGADTCRLTVSPSGDMILISKSGDGCLFLHGASCPGFEGRYRRIGGKKE